MILVSVDNKFVYFQVVHETIYSATMQDEQILVVSRKVRKGLRGCIVGIAPLSDWSDDFYNSYADKY